MVAVSNTSPISNLAITGRLDLLRSQFSQVLIPEAVRTELERMPNLEAKASIEDALRNGWLLCRAVANRQFAAALGNDLDKGEAEAIALATEIQADVLLIDEKEGRAFARQAGLVARGVLGVLIRAKAMGEIASVQAEIAALRNRAGFFIAYSLEADVLRSVGE
jgi:predicted nucleic acid-binding protein